jgi:hypothetical protein
MISGFMKNIKPMTKLLKELSTPPKIEGSETVMARPSKLVMAVPDEQFPKKSIPIME